MKRNHFPIVGCAAHDVRLWNRPMQDHSLEHYLLGDLFLSFQPRQNFHWNCCLMSVPFRNCWELLQLDCGALWWLVGWKHFCRGYNSWQYWCWVWRFKWRSCIFCFWRSSTAFAFTVAVAFAVAHFDSAVLKISCLRGWGCEREIWWPNFCTCEISPRDTGMWVENNSLLPLE